MQVITKMSALNVAIDGVIQAASQLTDDIQSVLMSVTFHAVAHGNIEPMLKLWNGVGKGVRKAAIQHWLDQHAPVQIDKEKGFVFSREKVALLADFADPVNPSVEDATLYAATLAAFPWVDCKPEKLAEESFDVMAMLVKLVDRADKAAKDGAEIKHKETLARLKSLLPQ